MDNNTITKPTKIFIGKIGYKILYYEKNNKCFVIINGQRVYL